MAEHYIVPSEQTFLLQLANYLIKLSDLQDICVVLPSRRAGLFLRYYLGKLQQKEFLLPRIYSIEDFINEQSIQILPYRLIDCYEFIGICAEVLRKYENLNLSFAWMRFLYDLFEEVEQELVFPENIQFFFEGQETVNCFLKNFSNIYRDIKKCLDKRLKNTLGMRFRLISENLDLLKKNLKNFKIILAGFFALTKAERHIFKHLIVEHDAVSFWETEGSNIHSILKREFSFLGINPKIISKDVSKDSPDYEFWVGPDFHTILNKLPKCLELSKNPDNEAILVADSNLLLPLLSVLPNENVNFTMGYSLSWTSFFSFLLFLGEVVKYVQGNAIRVQDIEALLTHGYIKAINVESALYLKKIITQVPREYIDLEFIRGKIILKEHFEFYLNLERNFLEPVLKLAEQKKINLNQIVLVWNKILLSVFDIVKHIPEEFSFFKRCYKLWEKEILVKISKSILGEQKLLVNEAVDFILEWLNSIFLTLKGEPLKGLQVLGLLESRLLSFKKLYVLGAQEGSLPSFKQQNPLFPEEIRKAIGLPSKEHHEVLQNYHFKRLVSSCKKVYFLYTENFSTTSYETKSMPSRYIEEAIWQEEKNNKKPEIKILDIKLKNFDLNLFSGIKKKKEDKEKIYNLLAQNVSATLLNHYLRCPLSFYFRYILGVLTSQISESLEIGKVVHQILFSYFLPYKEREGFDFKFDLNKLKESINNVLENDSFFQNIEQQRTFFIKKTILSRISNYLIWLEKLSKNSKIKILDLEKEFQFSFKSNVLNKKIMLIGKVDRLERRDDDLYVLDYKTGNIKFNKNLFLENKEINFSFLQEKKFDFQLPIYIYLIANNYNEYPIFSNYVLLSNFEIKERSFFKLNEYPKQIEFESRLSRYIDIVIEHMLESEEFSPTMDSRNCLFCSYFYLCPVGR
ncbi:PD-(D/E)XK nuclease superfamily protein [Desulfonauticus submarinus]|uniref:PD-(D/E)XK nuclease superfamily protein n=1 Tax=Desulfonauticus submarinus TaxID=206665 RepID=A0A1H0CRG7_9BACT|nr:PD-(D/E)XK nuclease family protein [Desulfonauticus submarinus]SDN60415.1 PD-(D/E)XK nuclease superfamily protein [Desulfonauticus submarinus]